MPVTTGYEFENSESVDPPEALQRVESLYTCPSSISSLSVKCAQATLSR